MKRLLFLAAALAGCGGQAASAPTAAAPVPATPERQKAPDFTLVDSDGHPVALHDLLKSGPVILAFFPKAFTGG
jgi:cytochrome oxidase Cu insertion factor (SCO1/SenC/PrrC family)